MFSCKFAAYFQNIFFWEHLWTAAPETMFQKNENRFNSKS